MFHTKTNDSTLFVKGIIAIIAVAALSLSACNSASPLLPNVDLPGSIRVTVVSQSDSAALYAIEGTGPAGKTFSKESANPTVEVKWLTAGDWTLNVRSKDSSGQVIENGTGTATVKDGEVSTVNISTTAESASTAPTPTTTTTTTTTSTTTTGGTSSGGNFDLTISYPVSMSAAAFEARLYPANGQAVPLSLSGTGGSAHSSSANLAAGAYLLFVRVTNGSAFKIGQMENVTVTDNQTTTLSLDFSSANLINPAVTINMTPQNPSAISVSLNGIASSITKGDTITAAASATGYAGDVFYAWNLNGTPLEFGDQDQKNLSFGSDLTAGSYTLSVKAYGSDGKSGGSVSASFTVVEQTTSPRPSAANTGYIGAGYSLSNLTTTGSLVITQNGTIIDRKNITGYVEVRAQNVTIKNSRINGTGYWPVRVFAGASLTIEYTEIIGTSTAEAALAADASASYTARYLDIHGSVDGLRLGSNVTVENSYIHDLTVISGVTHNDGMQMLSGSHVIVRNNAISLNTGCNSTIIIQTDMGLIDDVLIDGNYLNGGGYCVFSRIGNYNNTSAPTNVRVQANRFGRSYSFGLFSVNGTVSFTDNLWDDNGTAVPHP